VITEEKGVMMLAGANPVPQLDLVDVDVEAAMYLATLEQRSSEVTNLDTKQAEPTSPKRPLGPWLIAAAAAVILGVAIVLVTSNSETAPVATTPTPTSVVDAAPTTISGQTETTSAPTTTLGQSSTTVIESALSDIPLWMGSGIGQWTPARSRIPFAITNGDNWNSFNLVLTDERFSLCPSPPGGGQFPLCNLASVAVLFLGFETVDETREFLASFEEAELVDEKPISIGGATGIRFEFAHEVPPLVGQAQGDLNVPVAVTDGFGHTPIGQGPLGRSIVSIVDVDGVIVTLAFQGIDVSKGGAEDAFSTYKEAGLGIIDSIIWGSS